MIQNEIEVDQNLRSEITKFFNSQAGKHFFDLLESMMPKPEEVPALNGDYAPPHIYQLRAGVTQGYIDCLYNAREIPNLLSPSEKTVQHQINNQEE